MDDTTIEFAIWVIILVIAYYIFNEVFCFKRLPALLFAATIASLIVYAVYLSVLAEILVTATFVVWTFYGITQAFRAVRVDALHPSDVSRKKEHDIEKIIADLKEALDYLRKDDISTKLKSE